MNIDKLVKKMKASGRAKTQRTGGMISFPARWKLPLPPTTNKLWHTVEIDGQKRRVLSKDARAYKRKIKLLIHGRVPDDRVFTLTLTVCMDLYTKKGKIRQLDATNRCKILEDAIADSLGYDDSRNFNVVLQKRHWRGTPKVIATLDTYEGETDAPDE